MEALLLLSLRHNLLPLQIHQLLYLPLLTFSGAIPAYTCPLAYLVEFGTSYEIFYQLPIGDLGGDMCTLI